MFHKIVLQHSQLLSSLSSQSHCSLEMISQVCIIFFIIFNFHQYVFLVTFINSVLRLNQNTVKPPSSSLLTNGHLLLLGTIFGHTKLISCSWSVTCGGQWCVTCVFSTQPQCLHSLHPVALASARMLYKVSTFCF